MQPEYNWKAILIGAIPVSVVIAYVFYSGLFMNLKWFLLIIGIAISIGITYYMDKKKHNVFTSSFIVIIAALTVHGLKKLGFI